MNDEQIAHREDIIAEMVEDVRAKYTEGQHEHGGNLWEKLGLIDEAIKEADDLEIYLRTLRRQLRHLVSGLPVLHPVQAPVNGHGHMPPFEE